MKSEISMWQITFALDIGISPIILMQVQNFCSKMLVLSRNKADVSRKVTIVELF